MRILKLFTLMLITFSYAFAQSEDAISLQQAFLSGELAWEDIEAAAKEEGSVNWFHWGGSDELNLWIEQVVKPDLAAMGIQLETSRVPDTRDAVDQVIADHAVGRGLGEGSVDAIWINGENFFTLASQNLLYGPFADKLPNSQYFFFDETDPRSAINLRDNGFPTDFQEVPWAHFQYTCLIDSARLDPSKAPTDFLELEAWLRENPGRFTYVRPPNYIGNTFVQSVLYAFSEEGFAPFQQNISELDAESFSKLVEPGLAYLKRIEPFLLGGGGEDTVRGEPIYPETEEANEVFLNNGEVDMQCQFGSFSAAVGVESGDYPETIRNIIFPESGMITNKSFITIPANAPNPAAALVLANYLSSPENHISKLSALGYAPGVDVPLLPEDIQSAVTEASPELYGVSFEDLATAQVPEANASIINLIETLWIDYIANQSDEPLETLVQRILDSQP